MGCVCEHRSDRGRFAVIFSVQKNMARQLQDAVRQLQNDAKDQLFLEYESQATFEYHHSQIAALRQAFSTLSDVVMGELSAIQAALAQSNRSTGALIAECNGDVVALKKGMLVLNDTLDAWSVKERGWAKDAELLKVSHAHLADWMQQVQRDVAALRDGMQSEKKSLWDQKQIKVALRDIPEGASQVEYFDFSRLMDMLTPMMDELMKDQGLDWDLDPGDLPDFPYFMLGWAKSVKGGGVSSVKLYPKAGK